MITQINFSPLVIHITDKNETAIINDLIICASDFLRIALNYAQLREEKKVKLIIENKRKTKEKSNASKK